MARKPSQTLKQVRQRNYLAKDFDALRNNLVNYATQYYPDRITDFSENSLGGLFVDLAAYIGDNLSFYLDHQFNELNPETAIETTNIQKALRAAGVQVYGASPAIAECTFYIEVPAEYSVSKSKYLPIESTLPVISANTILGTTNGIDFTLLEELNFSKKNRNGDYIATIETGTVSGQVIKTLIMSLKGNCISGSEKTKSYSIGDFAAFRKITLPDRNLTEIISVYDDLGNTYYEVNDLTEDVVYKSVGLTAASSSDEIESLEVIPAPYRFTKTMELSSGLTTLTFGGGNADSMEESAIPDPTEFAISLPGSKTFSRTAINPQKLLNTRTLGVAGSNTTLTIVYRYGGGLSHNVSKNSIVTIKSLQAFFPKNPDPRIAQQVTNSIEVNNLTDASGGEDPPSLTELKALIPSIKNSQQRIVTKEDLLARIYTIPPNFGRVFRAATHQNKYNAFSTSLYIVSRDNSGYLTTSSDKLKINLTKYLNSYRMISDAIDILDCPIINFKIEFNVVIDPRFNQSIVLETLIDEIKGYFSAAKMQIDKPIIIAELYELLFSVDGVISLPIGSDPIKFSNLSGNQDNRAYSNFSYDLRKATIKSKGMIYPPEGGIFELKYPDFDIVGRSV